MLAETISPPTETEEQAQATPSLAVVQDATTGQEPPGEPPTAEASAEPGPPYYRGLTMGRIVHFVLDGRHRPAIVVNLGEEPGSCNVRVFTDPEDAQFGGILCREAVTPDATGQSEGTWHWPERAG